MLDRERSSASAGPLRACCAASCIGSARNPRETQRLMVGGVWLLVPPWQLGIFYFYDLLFIMM